MRTRSMSAAVAEAEAPTTRRTRSSTTKSSANKSASSKLTEAKKYAARDHHQMFFEGKPTRKAKATNKRDAAKKAKKNKPPPWTNKQRNAFAGAHYVINAVTN